MKKLQKITKKKKAYLAKLIGRDVIAEILGRGGPLIGEELYALRCFFSKTTRELAEIADCSHTAIQKYEDDQPIPLPLSFFLHCYFSELLSAKPLSVAVFKNKRGIGL